jgi:plastocyanin
MYDVQFTATMNHVNCDPRTVVALDGYNQVCGQSANPACTSSQTHTTMSAALFTLSLLLLSQLSLCTDLFPSLPGVVLNAAQTVGPWDHPLTPALPWVLSTTTASGPTSVQDVAVPTATVTVGIAGELKFSPASLNASVGSVIAFDFLGRNHTLTQSTLQNPCRKNGSIDTGFNQFNPSNFSGRFVVELKVTTQDPQWFFCAQLSNVSHCHAGMLFSLNSNGKHLEFLHNAEVAITDPTTTTHACQIPPQSSVTSSSSQSTKTNLLVTETSSPSNVIVIQPSSSASLETSPAISNLGSHGVAMSLSLQALAVLLLL